ncbi:MAG: glycosyltransferase [Planctomycetota bacterium]
MIIPTRRGDSPTLHACLSALPSDAQVIVSIDDEHAPEPDVARFECARVVRGPNAGPAAARNRAIEHIDRDAVLFLNDDVVPEVSCVEHHVRAHAEGGRPSLFIGDAPWDFGRTPAVIDRLVSETPVVFFYSTMGEHGPTHDWGYRHAWTLNLSLPVSLMQRFDERLRYPMLDDIEWAYRVTRGGTPVRFLPGGRVTHLHRPLYTAQTLWQRERLFGSQCRVLRRINPACAYDLFGNLDEPAWLHRDADGQAAFASFERIAERPGVGVDIEEVFDACRPWREAARREGWHTT